jgi:Tfp pilus assembly pilus retraction ATPase PilT
MRIIQDMFGRKVEQKEVNYKVAMMKEAPQTGIIVLGPTSSKTTLINEFISLFNPTKRNVEVFNPNSLELKYFLGENIMGRWEQGIV